MKVKDIKISYRCVPVATAVSIADWVLMVLTEVATATLADDDDEPSLKALDWNSSKITITSVWIAISYRCTAIRNNGLKTFMQL